MNFSELPDMANADLLTYTFSNQAVKEDDTVSIPDITLYLDASKC